MTSHQMHATTLTGFENLPKFHGPGRKRLRPKKSLRATGVVKAVYCAMAPNVGEQVIKKKRCSDLPMVKTALMA